MCILRLPSVYGLLTVKVNGTYELEAYLGEVYLSAESEAKCKKKFRRDITFSRVDKVATFQPTLI